MIYPKRTNSMDRSYRSELYSPGPQRYSPRAESQEGASFKYDFYTGKPGAALKVESPRDGPVPASKMYYCSARKTQNNEAALRAILEAYGHPDKFQAIKNIVLKCPINQPMSRKAAKQAKDEQLRKIYGQKQPTHVRPKGDKPAMNRATKTVGAPQRQSERAKAAQNKFLQRQAAARTHS